MECKTYDITELHSQFGLTHKDIAVLLALQLLLQKIVDKVK